MGNNAFDPGTSQESRVRSTSIGRDPNDFTNAEGNLLNDRTHTVTITGNYEVPNVEVLIGGELPLLHGKPWAQQTSIRDELPQGRRSIYIEPLGTQRLSSQSMHDCGSRRSSASARRAESRSWRTSSTR